jgi:hypothetical protein
MFIEVYMIPASEWGTKDKSKVKVEANKRTVNVSSILRVQPSTNEALKDRAELVMSDKVRYHVLGSYEEVIARVNKVDNVERV